MTIMIKMVMKIIVPNNDDDDDGDNDNDDVDGENCHNHDWKS